MPLKEPLNERQVKEIREKINEIRTAIDQELWEHVKSDDGVPGRHLAEARVLDRVVHQFAEALEVWLK